jgi:ankyrin repeat protein
MLQGDAAAMNIFSSLSFLSGSECQPDERKMMSHILNCIAALLQIRRMGTNGHYHASEGEITVFMMAIESMLTLLAPHRNESTDFIDASKASPLLNQFILVCLPHSNATGDKDAQNSQISWDKWYPLIFATGGGDIVPTHFEEVLRSYSSDATETLPQMHDMTIEHLAVSTPHQSATLLHLLSNYSPDLANRKDSNNEFPLHYAAKYSESPEVMQWLVHANPAAITAKGTSGYTPLHYILEREHAEKRLLLLECMILADHTVVSIEDDNNKTPLHMACNPKGPCDADIIKRLVTINPAAAKAADKHGNLPLHMVCEWTGSHVKAAEVAIEALLVVYKGAAATANSEGKLPLHVAAYWSSPAVVRKIFAACPNAVVVNSPAVGTPLHQAASRGESEGKAGEMEIIHFLHEQYEQAVCVKDPEFGWAPVHFAAFGGHCTVLEAVWRLFPPALKLRATMTGDLPLDVLLAQLMLRECDTLSDEANKLRFLLRQHPAKASISKKYVEVCADGESGASMFEDDASNTVSDETPSYFKRILLRALPSLDPTELRKLNYAERRMAMFLFYGSAVGDIDTTKIWRLLRRSGQDGLIKGIISFL